MVKQQRSQETRDHLLEAALACFAQHGYQAASVEEICRVAGVSKGAFYHHFDSKQAVFLELLEHWLGGLDAGLEAIRAQTPDAATALRQMVQLAGGLSRQAQGNLPLFLDFLSQARLDPQVWQATIDPYRHYQRYFAGLIQSGVDDGSMGPVDPDAAARLLVAVAVGWLLQSVLDPQAADWGAVLEDHIRTLFQGLQGRRG